MSEPVASPTRAEADGEPAASSGRRPSYRPSVRRGLLDLKLWQRFHVRLTLLYGAFVLVALGIMTAAFYRAGVGIALDGVRTRLAGTTVAIARGLDPDELAQLRVPADAAKPAYKGMLDDFTAIDGAESDILSIYVLVPAGQAGMFTFAFDYVSPGKHTAAAASIGQTYDARDNAKLQNGMKEPTVETEISATNGGRASRVTRRWSTAKGSTLPSSASTRMPRRSARWSVGSVLGGHALASCRVSSRRCRLLRRP